MPSEKLDNFSKQHPELAPLIRGLREYLRWQRERGVKELIPRVAGAKLGLSEADTLGLLTLFQDAGFVRPRYDVICTRTDGIIESFDALKDISDELFCKFCGDQHSCDDVRVELVFEIVNGQSADAAA